MAMPFRFSPPRTPEDPAATPKGWLSSAQIALEMGRVLLSQLIASALWRCWEQSGRATVTKALSRSSTSWRSTRLTTMTGA